MSYRLLLDIEVVEFMASLPRREQLQVRRHLAALQATPARFADFQEADATGRLLDVHVHRGFAFYYWEDFADRHVKLMRIRRADG
jgi:hypothetical protein